MSEDSIHPFTPGLGKPSEGDEEVVSQHVPFSFAFPAHEVNWDRRHSVEVNRICNP